MVGLGNNASLGPRAVITEGPPVGGELRAVGVTVALEHVQFPRGERHARSGGGRPSRKTSLGKAFGTEPKPLLIVGQEFKRRARTVANHIDRAAQRILVQGVATQRGQPVYSLAKVDGLDGQKDPVINVTLR